MKDSHENGKTWDFSGWTTRDLMVTIVLGLAVAVVSIPLRLGTASLGAAFGPIASVPASAYVVLGGIFVAYVVRRPGAAALSQLVVGLVLMIFMPGGFFLIILYVIHAIAIELPFAVTRYQRWGDLFLFGAGGFARLLILGTAWIAAGLSNFSPLIQLGIIAGALIAGGIGGLLAKALAQSLAKAGVFTIGGLDPDRLEALL
ncbi:MAG: ECF transporter S component [Chloroflexota bacterium]